MTDATSVPTEFEPLVERVRNALAEIRPAGPPMPGESKALMLSSRTKSGRALPAYYLVYFLLVDLLGYQDLGQWEKVAWIIPIRYQGRLYSIEHRKFGVGVFSPNHDPNARMGAPPSDQAEADASEIVRAIKKAIKIAAPYFEWRANQAASTSQLNVLNSSSELFDRYVHFRERFESLTEKASESKDEWQPFKIQLEDGTEFTTSKSVAYVLRREAVWTAQAAIDAFFSWTEHAFIHLAVLQGRACTGREIAALAEADWKTKFKAALDFDREENKKHYQILAELRTQIRNFMAHGAFGKRGEAFSFHTGAGAVPVLLTQKQNHKYAFTGSSAFDEATAIIEIEQFFKHLWNGELAPAKIFIFSSLSTILTYSIDGTYSRAMQSVQDMTEFVKRLSRQSENAANMDW